MLWNDDYYHMLEKIWGTEWMQKVGESHREANDWIQKVIEEEGFDGGYSRIDGYLVANDEGVSLKTLEAVVQALFSLWVCAACAA